MTLPLIILAILSLIGGWVGIPEALGGHNEFDHFLAPVFNAGMDIAANPQHFFMERVDAIVSASRRRSSAPSSPGTATATSPAPPPRSPQSSRPSTPCSTTSTGSTKSTAASSSPRCSSSRASILNGLIDGGIVQGSRLRPRRHHPRRRLARPPHPVRKHSLLRRLARPGAAAVIAIVLFGHHGLPH